MADADGHTVHLGIWFPYLSLALGFFFFVRGLQVYISAKRAAARS